MKKIEFGDIYKNEVDDKYIILSEHSIKDYYVVLFVPKHEEDPVKEQLMYVKDIEKLMFYEYAEQEADEYLGVINELRWL